MTAHPNGTHEVDDIDHVRLEKGLLVAGIDVGSMGVKTVLLDANASVVSYSIVPTGFSARARAEDSFREALAKAGAETADVRCVISTGYGRNAAPFSAGQVTEITCHGRGAHHLLPEVRTVIDIGGQDSKVIGVTETGGVTRFAMNDKCAAGTGRFLEVMARAMDVGLDEMGGLSLHANGGVLISSMCTVFAESEVISLVAGGVDRAEIVQGINNAIARRVGSLVEQVGLREKIAMTGGVAKNSGVVRALEARLRTTLVIPGEPQTVGALGAALFALDRALNEQHSSK